jgi:hypothetical protein
MAEQQQEAKPVYTLGSGIPQFNDEQGQSVEEQQETALTQEEIVSQQQVLTEQKDDTNEAQVEKDENSSSFSIPTYNEDGTLDTTKVKENPIVASSDWKEELKKADRKEVLKELGYDDFISEFAEFRKNGGDAYKYLEAKAFDWNKVSPQDLVIDDLKSQYPNLTDDKIEKLYQAKYKQSEFASDDDKEIGAIQLEADADLIRNKRIKEQESFQIPQIEKRQEVDNQQAVLEQQRLQEESQKQVLNFFKEHEATKSLIQSKRVAIELGDNGKFNFNVDKPEVLMDVVLNSEKWQRAIATNPQEADVSKLVPDVSKLQRIALAALNPNYEKDLVNYGKSLGLKAIVEEGQNAKRPIGAKPTQANETLSESFKLRARSGTIGG